MDLVQQLQQRLDRLERLEAARSCVTRYVRACDAGEVGTLIDEVFTADAVLHVPGADYCGQDAIATFFREAFAAKPRLQRHFLASQTATVRNDGSVEVRSYFLYLSADAKLVLGCGSYRDLIVIEDGIGRIHDKAIAVDVMEDLAARDGARAS